MRRASRLAAFDRRSQSHRWMRELIRQRSRASEGVSTAKRTVRKRLHSRVPEGSADPQPEMYGREQKDEDTWDELQAERAKK